jgi:ABC-type transport system involved in multi-copper enzyme maturation permease subunit
MPIYEPSYRRFDGTRTEGWVRSWALVRNGVGRLLKERRFLFLLALAWVPAIIRGGQIYAARQFPQAGEWLQVSPKLWESFLTQQISLLPVVLVALYAGAGAIASDLRSGALVIYLSKPLSRTGYLLGKILPVFFSLLSITLVPALVLLGLHLALADDLSLLRDSPWLPLSVFVYSGCVATYFSLIVLAISSLTRSGRLAAAGFVLVTMGSHFAYQAASRLTFGDAPPFLSIVGAAVDAARVFFEGGSRSYPSLFTMAALMVAAVFLMTRRLRSFGIRS